MHFGSCPLVYADTAMDLNSSGLLVMDQWPISSY